MQDYPNQYVYDKNGLIVENNILKKVSPSVEKLVIPSNIKMISTKAFDECKFLKSIESESSLYGSKNGCLYYLPFGELIITVSDNVVLPCEIRTLDCGCLKFCTGICFEDTFCLASAGKSISRLRRLLNDISTYEMYNIDSMHFRLYNAVKTQLNLVIGKTEKMNALSAASACAVLQKFISDKGLKAKLFRLNDEIFGIYGYEKKIILSNSKIALAIPVGEYGIEIALPGWAWLERKEELSELFETISTGVKIQEFVKYCYIHRITVLSKNAHKYVVITGYERGDDFRRRFVELSFPESVETIYIYGCVREICFKRTPQLKSVRKIVFGGTKSEWSAVKGKAFLCGAMTSVVECSDGTAEILYIIEKNVHGERELIGCHQSIAVIKIPRGVVSVRVDAFVSSPQNVSIVIPVDVKKFTSGIYDWPIKLPILRLYYNGTRTQWDKIEGRNYFRECGYLSILNKKKYYKMIMKKLIKNIVRIFDRK